MKQSLKDHPDVWGKLLRAAAQLALIAAEKIDPTKEGADGGKDSTKRR